MQSNEPMIHTMYERMSSLVYSLMKKFINKKAINETVDGRIRAKHGSNLTSVDLSENQMKLDQIDIGTRAKTILISFDINSEQKEAFRKRCLDFYVSCTSYLISKLPLSCKILKDAQYLHPEKRNYSASLNAAARLSLKVASTLKNHLGKVFGVPENTTVSDVCDLVKSQWQIYQLIDIPKEWHTLETASAKKERQHTESYWRNVEKSWIDLTPKDSEEKSLRIDSYWSRVFEVKDSDGRKRFPQLAAFVKVILTLSHGNAGPEQGFSINKSIIDAHGTRLGEDILIALRRIKHRLLQVGSCKNFIITKPLLESVKLSRSRYEAELKANEQKAKSVIKEKEIKNKSEIEDIESKIRKIEKGIEVAEKAISDGSKQLEKHLRAKPLDPEKLQADNSLIQMGVQRKKKLAGDISKLRKKKKAKLAELTK
ncbi:unnamed protein product [Meganyctiphanes norvegica]|uniref:Uncharacterized protein n=1 Tax=Meganyctiphanes norvegica TaxID=48144 RepID=A0AAV2SV00_MEGNR